MKKTLFPLGLTETFAHFFEKMASICLVGAALLIITILAFYSPLDPSFNTATSDHAHHPLGVLGSYPADFLYQLFGNYGYCLALMLFGYSVRLWKLKPLSLFTRPIALTLGIFLLGIGTASFLRIKAGTVSYVVFYYSIQHRFPHPVIVLLQIAAIASGLALVTFACYMPLSSRQLKKALKNAINALEHGTYILYGLIKFSQPVLKNTAKKIFRYIHMSIHKGPFSLKKTRHPPKERTREMPASQSVYDAPLQQSEQLSLFDPDKKTKESSLALDEQHQENGEQTSNKAISHFKEWLKEKERNNKKSSNEKKQTFIPQYNNHNFELPCVDLLDPAKTKQIVVDPNSLEEQAHQLETVLAEFGVKGEIVNIRPGPVVTMYELMPAAGIKSSRVIGLSEDIARSMCALSARIAVIPGKNVIGIELPNPTRETVYLRDLLQSDAFKKSTGSLRLILGKDIGGQPSITDLARMPHLLVAGTTGSGKSVSVNTMILSLLYQYTPDQCKFIMIDPKMLELSIYNDVPHLLTPVVTDPKKAVVALKWAVKEMESRYRAMSKVSVRNIDGYNTRLKEAKENGEVLMRKVQTGFDPDSGKPVFETQPLDFTPLPYIVVVVDEMADLMLVAGKDIEAAVQRLAQMARAAGIHLIMATQRPSVDVITGTIKANFPTRISFQVTSKIDSRTILGEQGAEQLLGQGDMLYMAGGGRIQRVHGPFVRDEEIERIVGFLKTQGEPSYVESVTQQDDEEDAEATDASNENERDQLYQQAVDLILREGKASTSFIQRHLQIGYNRAARLIDLMEKDGLISAANHAGKREILGKNYG